MEKFIFAVNGIVWGPVLLILLLGTSIFYTIRLRALPWRKIGYACRQLFSKSDKQAAGDITGFQALMTALSATVGTGNIAGVATAIGIGGPGALFWMWLTALFGMSLKYSESLLGVYYREKNSKGNFIGGPMYYIKKGLGDNWKWMAALFAFFGSFAGFGLGNTIQANSVADILNISFGLSELGVGLVIAFLVGLVMLGGIKSISRIAAALVPLMGISYLLLSLIVIVMNIEALPSVFALIIESAFSSTAAQGGFVGATIIIALQTGVARSIFSNEAGMGSAPIAHAAAKTDSPVKQASIAMLGTFIDTIVICSLTGIVILLTGAWTSGAEGAKMTVLGFNSVIPNSDIIISVIMCLLAFTTIIGWSYYSERCFAYLLGERYVFLFRIAWVAAIPFGAIYDFKLIWKIADTLNGLMAFPNLIALLLLSHIVVRETKKYWETS